MNKETRIFILGFFYLLIGTSIVLVWAAKMYDGEWDHACYEYLSLILGFIICFKGNSMFESVTKLKD